MTTPATAGTISVAAEKTLTLSGERDLSASECFITNSGTIAITDKVTVSDLAKLGYDAENETGAVSVAQGAELHLSGDVTLNEDQLLYVTGSNLAADSAADSSLLTADSLTVDFGAQNTLNANNGLYMQAEQLTFSGSNDQTGTLTLTAGFFETGDLVLPESTGLVLNGTSGLAAVALTGTQTYSNGLTLSGAGEGSNGMFIVREGGNITLNGDVTVNANGQLVADGTLAVNVIDVAEGGAVSVGANGDLTIHGNPQATSEEEVGVIIADNTVEVSGELTLGDAIADHYFTFTAAEDPDAGDEDVTEPDTGTDEPTTPGTDTGTDDEQGSEQQPTTPDEGTEEDVTGDVNEGGETTEDPSQNDTVEDTETGVDTQALVAVTGGSQQISISDNLGKMTLNEGATLNIEFADTVTLSADDRDAIFGALLTGTTGTINYGDAVITGGSGAVIEPDEDGNISLDDAQQLAGGGNNATQSATVVVDEGADIANPDDDGKTISVGSISVGGTGTEATMTGSWQLNAADKNTAGSGDSNAFIANADGEAMNVTVNDGSLSVANGGTLGNVTIATAEQAFTVA